jgi:multicomponent Na+:H+ antiporter subunit E
MIILRFLRKCLAVVKLLLLFLKELILSNIAVTLHVLRPRLKLQPGIFAYRTELTSDLEVTLLANLITLTPGTQTMEISPDGRILYIHAMDIQDVDTVRAQIRGSFEKAIMEVTR